jgi:hypothetical protein
MSARPLDITSPRGLGALLGTTLTLYARHFGLFGGLALAIVVVVDTIVFGIGTSWLFTSHDAYDEPEGLWVIESLLPVLVLVPLISATHAQAVAALGRGRVPSIAETLQEGARFFAPVLGVVLMYTAGTVLGLLLLVIPGVYLFVAWFVAAPAVVIEGKRGGDAIRRSQDLVHGSWWRVFGIALVVTAIGLIGNLAFVALAELLADSANSMAVYLAGWILGDVVLYSFTALATTLLFFDLRARQTVTAATHAPAADG